MWLRQNGKCRCGARLEKGNYIIEHIQALARGGTDTLDNKCLNCKPCADAKTFHPRSLATTIGGDNYEAKKTNRLSEKVAGTWHAGKPKQKIEGRGFDKTYRKKMDGTVVRRD